MINITLLSNQQLCLYFFSRSTLRITSHHTLVAPVPRQRKKKKKYHKFVSKDKIRLWDSVLTHFLYPTSKIAHLGNQPKKKKAHDKDFGSQSIEHYFLTTYPTNQVLYFVQVISLTRSQLASLTISLIIPC